MNRTEMTLLQRAELELLWLWAWLFAVMPYWFKYYVVENLLYFLLCYVLRYRRKVVRRNLRNSFPKERAGARGDLPPFLPDAGRTLRRYHQHGPHERRQGPDGSDGQGP